MNRPTSLTPRPWRGPGSLPPPNWRSHSYYLNDSDTQWLRAYLAQRDLSLGDRIVSRAYCDRRRHPTEKIYITDQSAPAPWTERPYHYEWHVAIEGVPSLCGPAFQVFD